MHFSSFLASLASGLALLATSDLAHSAPLATVVGNDTVVVLYSEIDPEPSSQVMGFPGLFIDSIDRMGASPDGTQWIVTLTLDTGAFFNDEFLVVNGMVQAREGNSPAYLPSGRNHEVFDQSVRILNSGVFSFAGDFTGNTANDDFVARGTPGGTIELLAREGDPLLGAPAGWVAGAVDSALVTDVGVGYEVASIVGGPPSTENNALMLNNTILAQEGVDAPGGQLSSTNATWRSFDRQKFWATSDGTHSLIHGQIDVLSTQNDVIVVDGQVVLQEGYPIPLSGRTDATEINLLTDSFMADNGNWIAEGQFEISFDAWVVYNGIPVAYQDEPIFPGSTELWNAPFDAVSCNTLGDFIVVGTTDGNVDSNQVVVFNGKRVVAREGDPVDLDGNGLFDDDVFLREFGANDFSLGDNRRLYFTGLLENGAGTNLGDFCGYIAIDGTPVGVPFCQPARLNCLGRSTTLTANWGSGVGSDLHLNATHGPGGEFGYFLVSAGFSETGIDLSQGRFCLLDGMNPFGRYNVNGGNLNSIGVFSADGQVFQNLVGTGTSAGDTGFDVPLIVPVPGNPVTTGGTWNFQLWHRDSCTTAGASNFSNGLSVTF